MPNEGHNRHVSTPANMRVAVVIVAYRAEATLAHVCADLPRDEIDDLIIIDDASPDGTAGIARSIEDAHVIVHPENRGYGGAQKTGFTAALQRGADIVILLHGDGQYDPAAIPATAFVLKRRMVDMLMGNRVRSRRQAVAGGMPTWKYVANRVLTDILNWMAGLNLAEWHSGYRAYTRPILEQAQYERASDAFAFDPHLLMMTHNLRFEIGEIPIPSRYDEHASSIRFWPAVRYVGQALSVVLRWRLHRWGILKCRLFEPKNTDAPSAADADADATAGTVEGAAPNPASAHRDPSPDP